MKWRDRNLRGLAEIVVGDKPFFIYRSSSRITEFFQDCDLEFVHTSAETRWRWAADRLREVLDMPHPNPTTPPDAFLRIVRAVMDKGDATEDDPGRVKAMAAINVVMHREGWEVFYDEHGYAQMRHIATNTVAETGNPHRPLTNVEIERRERLITYLEKCSEDELIEDVLLPMFRRLGFHRITAAGHKDKSLEYGKDIWMKYTLPTLHVIYFGIQVKKGKVDASGVSKGGSSNIGEMHNQVSMMLGHEIFDPELSRRVLVDHAFIVAGGEITKQARNWIAGRLDTSKRSALLFMDREDILNLFVVNNVPLPKGALPPSPPASSGGEFDDDIPF